MGRARRTRKGSRDEAENRKCFYSSFDESTLILLCGVNVCVGALQVYTKCESSCCLSALFLILFGYRRSNRTASILAGRFSHAAQVNTS